MPFVFLVIGLVLLVASVRGQHMQLIALLKSEFVGTNSFIPWVLAIIILGSLGYIKTIKPVADAFVALIILVMLLSNKGFFAQLNSQMRAPAAPTPSPPSSPPSSTPPGEYPSVPTPPNAPLPMSATAPGAF